MKRSCVLTTATMLLVVISTPISSMAKGPDTPLADQPISTPVAIHTLEPKPPSRIAFAFRKPDRTKGIAVMNSDESHVTELSHDTFNMLPSWSPNGETLAYLTMRNEDLQIMMKYNLCMHFSLYVMNADGSNQHRAIDVPVFGYYSWSPDGKSIAFVSGFEDENNYGKDGVGSCALYVSNLDGQTPRRLTDVEGKVDPAGPSWSPQGTEIAYSGKVGKARYCITIARSDGSDKRTLTPGENPQWSPDGKRILFRAKDAASPGSPLELFVINVDGSGRKKLTENAGYVQLMKWSPDGKKILYGSEDKLMVMDADGGNAMDLAFGVGSIEEDQAVFTDGGARVVFVGITDHQHDLFVVDADGNNIRNLTNNPMIESYPSSTMP